MNESTLRVILSAFVVFAADPDDRPSDAEIRDYVDTMMNLNAIETRAIDDRDGIMSLNIPVYAYAINFYDDCEISIIAFVDDANNVTHAMISADMQPYIPMTI